MDKVFTKLNAPLVTTEAGTPGMQITKQIITNAPIFRQANRVYQSNVRARQLLMRRSFQRQRTDPSEVFKSWTK